MSLPLPCGMCMCVSARVCCMCFVVHVGVRYPLCFLPFVLKLLFGHYEMKHFYRVAYMS